MTRSKKITITVCICLVCTCTFILGIFRGDQGNLPFADLRTEDISQVRTAFEQPDGSHYVLNDGEKGTLADYLRKVRINSERQDPAIDGGFIGMFYLEMNDGRSVMVSASNIYFTYGDDPLNADMYQVDVEMTKPIEDMFYDLAKKYASQDFKEKHSLA